MKTKYIIPFILIGLLVNLNSCLKDKPVTDYSNIQPVIIIPNANWPSSAPANSLSYSSSGGSQQIQLYARVSWENTLKKDLSVTFIKDTSALNSYNALYGTNLIYMPDSCYSLSSLQLSIPAGQREAYLPITIYPDKLGVSSDNTLVFTITDAQGQTIADNYKTIVLPVIVQ